jgi:ribosomal protein L37E
MTARAAPRRDGTRGYRLRIDTIKAWSKEHLGQILPITYQKDAEMLELWDDRAIQVKPNTGQRADGEKSMSAYKELEAFAKGDDAAEEEARKEEEKDPKELPLQKGGPYIGPRGGKYADPDHKIPWSDHQKATAKGKKAKPHPTVKDDHVDSTAVRELEQFADNDYELYKQREAFEANVVKKMASGNYDHAQAPKLWGYHADRVAAKYKKEFGGEFDKPTRQALAYEMAKDFHDAVKTNPGDYEKHVPKKYKKDWGKTKKSMDDPTAMLGDFLEKSQAMPTGKPTMGGSGNEQGEGSLAGKGKTSGSGDSSAGTAVGAPAPAEQKLSEDDEKDEKQMKPHKKPIEKLTHKSVTPASQRDMVAQEQAAAVSQIRKSEDGVRYNAALPSPAEPVAPKVQKSRTWNQGEESLFQYTNDSDLAASELVKSNSFYIGGSPALGRRAMLMQQTKCPRCETSMAKSLSACPECGFGTVQHGVLPVQSDRSPTIQKSVGGPPLRPVNTDIRWSEDSNEE